MSDDEYRPSRKRQRPRIDAPAASTPGAMRFGTSPSEIRRLAQVMIEDGADKLGLQVVGRCDVCDSAIFADASAGEDAEGFCNCTAPRELD